MLRMREALVVFSAGLALPAASAGYLLWKNAPVPHSVEILGIFGNIGEWEMTGKLERQGEKRELAGSIKMSHVGWCSQDGPLEKAGELRVRLARLSSSITAKVRVDGLECDYEGSLSDAYAGMMNCPERRPVQMLLWIR